MNFLEKVLMDTRDNDLSVPREMILRGMASDDAEEMGAAFSFLMDARRVRMLDRAIDRNDVNAFLIKYFRRCINDDQEGRWADSRYSALREIVSLMRGLLNDVEYRNAEIEMLRDFLADIYKKGSDEIRVAVVNGCLEHVVTKRGLASVFKPWEKDADLSIALQEARFQSDVDED